MEIKQYTRDNHSSCVQICKSNTPDYFAEEELAGLEIWLNGQDEGRLAYKNTKAEYFYVLEHDGIVAGCGGFYAVRDSRIANFVWGMVDRSRHNQGFGKLLFEYRVGQIKSMYPGYQLVLDTTQHTYKFFEKHGFVVTQIRKDFYGPGLDRYDMTLLS